MARKTLLTESEIRQFMKLANIKPIGEGYGEMPKPGQRSKKAAEKMEEAEEQVVEEAEEQVVEEAEEQEEMEEARRVYTKGQSTKAKDIARRDRKAREDSEERLKKKDPELYAASQFDPSELDEGYDMPGARDEEEGEEIEMDVEAGEMGDMPEPMEEPMDDMDAMPEPEGMEMGDMGGSKEQKFADVVNAIAELIGEDELDIDVKIGGEEEMGGEVEAEEGGDELDMADAAPEEDEEMEMGPMDEEMGEQDIVQEVARRVAARLLREQKQEAMANKLAERIFRKLTSK